MPERGKSLNRGKGDSTACAVVRFWDRLLKNKHLNFSEEVANYPFGF